MNDYLQIFILAFSILAVAFIISRLLKNQAQNFDERQEMIRGKAYKYTVKVMIIYSGLYVCCSQLMEKEFLITSVALILGMFIGLVAFAVYSIWNEAFFSLDRTPKLSIFVLIAIVLLNSEDAISTITNGNLIENGTLTLESVTLMCAIAFVVILSTLLIKIAINKKAEQEGE